MKNPWVVIAFIMAVLIAGSVWYSNSVSDKYDEGVNTDISHIKGNPEAAITLVEFSDFQCPACAQAHPVVEDVLKEFGDKIKFEYKHFPLPGHPLAEPAARAAEAAGQQGKFFEFYNLLFENQNAWTKSANPTAVFVQYAEELGLDVQKFRQHMKSSLLSDHIDANRKEGFELGVTGTPTFFLNGEKMTPNSFADFYKQISSTVNPDVKFELPKTATSTQP